MFTSSAPDALGDLLMRSLSMSILRSCCTSSDGLVIGVVVVDMFGAETGLL